MLGESGPERPRVNVSTSLPEPIGVGIVGLSAAGGWAAFAHVPALAALDGYELRALSASSVESARAAGEKHGVPLAFGSPEELAGRDEVDLVVVTVRVARHREPVLAALDASKPVLCEWPLAMDLTEAEELAAVASDRGVGTAVGLQGRSAPVVRYLRDLVADGYVGDVVSTSLVASAGAWGETFLPREPFLLDRDSGNTMLSVAVGHLTDSLAMCLGEFAELNAVMANRRSHARNAETGELVPMTTDDQIAVNGVLEGGAVASLHVRGGESRAANLYWEINGTDGDLLVTGDLGTVDFGHVTIRGARLRESTLAELTVPERYELVPALSGREAEPSYNVAHAYVRLRSDWADGTELVPTFADAVRRHRLLDRIERAAASGGGHA
jgi:predicted dehydrogenase